MEGLSERKCPTEATWLLVRPMAALSRWLSAVTVSPEGLFIATFDLTRPDAVSYGCGRTGMTNAQLWRNVEEMEEPSVMLVAYGLHL
jgi:hypothetical protein